MAETTVTIASPGGLRVRPASRIVQEAQGYVSDIMFLVDGKEASAKSLFSLQMLEMSHGKEVVIVAKGHDEQSAVEAIAKLIESVVL
ncbi:phosphocarrier protein HPr [Streptomyces lydicus]|uniref:Phosphocarrier protein HPr n=1 Tax=Streptomyces lydicus TaxID=47763 RepID=A0A3S9YLM2_9ACTN|nr:HPr family phosphocarrier protein [Streptomyces lydicus]AZS75912.1 phosphocarrier protein HPr [Streptomyces lydicus]